MQLAVLRRLQYQQLRGQANWLDVTTTVSEIVLVTFFPTTRHLSCRPVGGELARDHLTGPKPHIKCTGILNARNRQVNKVAVGAGVVPAGSNLGLVPDLARSHHAGDRIIPVDA